MARGVPVRDLLAPVLKSGATATAKAALELYIRRIYRTHLIDDFVWAQSREGVRGIDLPPEFTLRASRINPDPSCFRSSVSVDHGMSVASSLFFVFFGVLSARGEFIAVCRFVGGRHLDGRRVGGDCSKGVTCER